MNGWVWVCALRAWLGWRRDKRFGFAFGEGLTATDSTIIMYKLRSPQYLFSYNKRKFRKKNIHSTGCEKNFAGFVIYWKLCFIFKISGWFGNLWC